MNSKKPLKGLKNKAKTTTNDEALKYCAKMEPKVARGNNRGAGGNTGNRPRHPRIKVGYTDLAKQADGTYSAKLTAEIGGGRGDEQVMFWIDLDPKGTEVSVDEFCHAQTLVTGLSDASHVVKAALVDGVGRIIRGTEVSRTMVIPKLSRFAKSAALQRDEIELRRLARELDELTRKPSDAAQEMRCLREQMELIRVRREHDECARPPSFVAKATAMLREEHELAELGLATGRLHHQLEREWNDREAEELKRELEVLRLRLDLDECGDATAREIRELSRRLAEVKIRKEIADAEKVPAKEIARPVIECVGSDGKYTLGGSVVYKDSSRAAGYPILISLAPLFGEPRIGKEYTDKDGYFAIPFEFAEKSADLHVIVGGVGGYEEFYDDLEGPPRRPRPLKRHDMKSPPPEVVARGIFATVRWHLANWRGK